jgi:hypothetical protein
MSRRPAKKMVVRNAAIGVNPIQELRLRGWYIRRGNRRNEGGEGFAVFRGSGGRRRIVRSGHAHKLVRRERTAMAAPMHYYGSSKFHEKAVGKSRDD